MTKYTIRGYVPDTDKQRYFLVEAVDENLARALFLVGNPEWEIKVSGAARCFSGGEHKGDLSVWQGQEGKTAVLCQAHGDPK